MYNRSYKEMSPCKIGTEEQKENGGIFCMLLKSVIKTTAIHKRLFSVSRCGCYRNQITKLDFTFANMTRSCWKRYQVKAIAKLLSWLMLSIFLKLSSKSFV